MSLSASGFDQFGSKLSSAISQQNNGQNIFLSPTSLSLAISMCAVGARNQTLEQMLRVLGVSSVEELTNIAGQILQIFPPNEPDDLPTEEWTDPNTPPVIIMKQTEFYTPLQLKLANRLYTQKQYKIDQKYLNLLQKSFQSDIKLEDFENESTKTVETINKWVEKQTNERIRNILSTKDINRNTRLVLINCIYFKGEWEDKFRERQTAKNVDFYGLNGVKTKIDLMYQKEHFQYAENKDLRIQIVHLPYVSSREGERFVFTVILPNQGVSVDEVEQKLNSDLNLKRQLLSKQNAKSQELYLYLPKFQIETKYELQELLGQIGMEDAIDGKKADFEGIIGKVPDDERIFISKVIHKTFLNVNEQGTEAAAAGAVIMERCGCAFGAKPEPIEFKADRPFLFFIRETERDLTLFSGKLVSPSSSNT